MRTTKKDRDRYSYFVQWSDEDQLFIGRAAEFTSLAAHGKTLEDALAEIKKVVGYAIEDLLENNEPVPEPFSTQRYSGKLNLRMPEYLHRKLATEAAMQNVSLNQLINLKLEKGSE